MEYGETIRRQDLKINTQDEKIGRQTEEISVLQQAVPQLARIEAQLLQKPTENGKAKAYLQIVNQYTVTKL